MPSLLSNKIAAQKSLSPPFWLAGLAASTVIDRLARSRRHKPPPVFDTTPRAEAERPAPDAPDDAEKEHPCSELRDGIAPLSVQRRRAREPGRGRQATSALEIPFAGWMDIAKRTWQQISENRLLAVAAGVVFFGLLALFPAITALVSSYALFADAAAIGRHLAFAAALMPEGAYGLVEGEIKRIAQGSGGGLSLAFATGLAIALWSANSGMKAMIDALNVIYGETEKRSFIRLNLISLMMTLCGLIFLLLAIGTVVVLPLVLSWLGLAAAGEWAIAVLRWPAIMIVIALGLAALYRFGPSRKAAQWRWLSVGALIATLLWVAGSALFSWYLSNFADYNATYGSLGAGIGLMMWLWLTSIAILLGGEINAQIEHQTACDTTIGRPKPLGARGAVVADSVGAVQ
jgi:membrane protein